MHKLIKRCSVDADIARLDNISETISVYGDHLCYFVGGIME